LFCLFAQLQGLEALSREQYVFGHFRLRTAHFISGSGEQGRTDFFYSPHGLMEDAVWSLLDGSRFSSNHYQYNDLGQMVRVSRVFSDGLTSSKELMYQEQGWCCREVFARSDGVSGQAEHHYDNRGFLLRTVADRWNGWLIGELRYTYEGAKLIGAVVMREGSPIGTVSYAYDDRGLLVQEHWQFDSGDWHTFSCEYESFDPEVLSWVGTPNAFLPLDVRTRVCGEFYRFGQEVTGPSDFLYAPGSNRLLEKVFTRSDGLQTHTEYQYASDGTLIGAWRHYSSGTVAWFSFTFDERRRLCNRHGYWPDGLESVETYCYDDRGRLKAADWLHMDRWLTGTLLFAHDPRGAIESGWFEGQPTKSHLVFQRDAQGLLSEIQWHFESGQMQVYQFQHEAVHAFR
jgi:hypothetical protein